MKTVLNVMYNGKEYSAKEIENFKMKILNKIPKLDLREGVMINNGTVLFRVGTTFIDPDAEKKIITVQQSTSRQVIMGN